MAGEHALALQGKYGSAMSGMLLAYLKRILLVLLAAAATGTLLYRRLQPEVRWWRAIICGFGAAFLGLSITWLAGMMNRGGLSVGPEGMLALIFPLGLFGLPAAIIRLFQRKGLCGAGAALAAWLLAALPAAILVHPWL